MNETSIDSLAYIPVQMSKVGLVGLRSPAANRGKRLLPDSAHSRIYTTTVNCKAPAHSIMLSSQHGYQLPHKLNTFLPLHLHRSMPLLIHDLTCHSSQRRGSRPRCPFKFSPFGPTFPSASSAIARPAALPEKMHPPRNVPSNELYPCTPPPPNPAASPAA
jgi:hypothetical protein